MRILCGWVAFCLVIVGLRGAEEVGYRFAVGPGSGRMQDCVPATLERMAAAMGRWVPEAKWVEECKTDMEVGTKCAEIPAAWRRLMPGVVLVCTYSTVVFSAADDGGRVTSFLKAMLPKVGGIEDLPLVFDRPYVWIGNYRDDAVHCALVYFTEGKDVVRVSHAQKYPDGHEKAGQYLEEILPLEEIILKTYFLFQAVTPSELAALRKAPRNGDLPPASAHSVVAPPK